MSINAIQSEVASQPASLSACLPACLPVCLSAYLSVCLPACLLYFIYLSTHLIRAPVPHGRDGETEKNSRPRETTVVSGAD
jgi:hypothetical protein